MKTRACLLGLLLLAGLPWQDLLLVYRRLQGWPSPAEAPAAEASAPVDAEAQ